MRLRTSRTQSISPVSTTSWLVSPRCSQRAVGARGALPHQRDQPADGAAVDVGAPGDRLGVTVGHQARQFCPGLLRRNARGDEAVQPRLLDGHHRREEGGVTHQVTGELVTRPEQVGHR